MEFFDSVTVTVRYRDDSKGQTVKAKLVCTGLNCNVGHAVCLADARCNDTGKCDNLKNKLHGGKEIHKCLFISGPILRGRPDDI